MKEVKGAIRIGDSKIAGRGVFARRTLLPGIRFDDTPAHGTGFNHSCAPNALMVRDLFGQVLYVVPIRMILKGEELTLDYRMGQVQRIMTNRAKDYKRLMRLPPRDCRPCKCSACRRTK